MARGYIIDAASLDGEVDIITYPYTLLANGLRVTTVDILNGDSSVRIHFSERDTSTIDDASMA